MIALSLDIRFGYKALALICRKFNYVTFSTLPTTCKLADLLEYQYFNIFCDEFIENIDDCVFEAKYLPSFCYFFCSNDSNFDKSS